MRERRGRGGDDGGGGRRRLLARTRERDAAAGAFKPESFVLWCSFCFRSRRVDVPGVPGGRREAAAGAVEEGERVRERESEEGEKLVEQNELEKNAHPQ